MKPGDLVVLKTTGEYVIILKNYTEGGLLPGVEAQVVVRRPVAQGPEVGNKHVEETYHVFELEQVATHLQRELDEAELKHDLMVTWKAKQSEKEKQVKSSAAAADYVN